MRISDWSSDVCSSDLAEPLEQAQARKVRLLLDRMDLKPGDRLLEIGSGWGYLAETAARPYGAQVTSITLSEEQLAHARARVGRAGLADRVPFSPTDTRAVDGRLAATARVEVLEAGGQQKTANGC